ncbi:hypothetical protein V8G54_002233 [Vigna mungo]|uniref:Myosin motor domain-containing protein n=1 Tax=Vigna mungo TaxID=3915 RepID=A0AAQ3SCP9_VIGMU
MINTTSRTITSSTQYIHNTFAVSVPSVILPDRKPVLQYLQGTLTSTDSIEYFLEDPSFAPKSTLPSQTQAHRRSLLECKNRDFYSVPVSATKREEDRQRMESQQRKDDLVAKSRLMAAHDRGLGFSDDMGGQSHLSSKNTSVREDCILERREKWSRKDRDIITMQYLAAIGGGSGTANEILQTNPILVAFGNGKTLRNDNSSRFIRFPIYYIDSFG